MARLHANIPAYVNVDETGAVTLTSSARDEPFASLTLAEIGRAASDAVLDGVLEHAAACALAEEFGRVARNILNTVRDQIAPSVDD